jgi:predicted amidohydrolase
MRKKTLKKGVIAGVQISIIPNDVKNNIQKVEEWLLKAIKENDAKIIVFPETITTGFAQEMTLSEFYKFMPGDVDNLFAGIKKICKAHKVYAIIPSYEKTAQKNVIYNSAFFINSKGKIEGVYRKTHLFTTEKVSEGGCSTPGMNYPVFKTEYGNVGIMICFDGDFPEIGRILALNGAHIIARPTALLRSFDIWEMTNRARAYDNHTYVIGVNAVGVDATGTNYFGHSMIVSPIAQTLALARGVEDIIYYELETEPLKYISYGSKAPMIFDHLQFRNLESYKDYLTRPGRSQYEPAKYKKI